MASDKGHIRCCILFPAEKEAVQGISCALGEGAKNLQRSVREISRRRPLTLGTESALADFRDLTTRSRSIRCVKTQLKRKWIARYYSAASGTTLPSS